MNRATFIQVCLGLSVVACKTDVEDEISEKNQLIFPAPNTSLFAGVWNKFELSEATAMVTVELINPTNQVSIAKQSIKGIGFIFIPLATPEKVKVKVNQHEAGTFKVKQSSGKLISLIDYPQLKQHATPVLIEANNDSYFIIQLEQHRYLTLHSSCTHNGCAITFNPNQTFICPCHGSSFSLDGTVINGPAERPLPEYLTTFNQQHEFITVHI
ncbi:MAG: Rieske 2Fe-2S domain-containing protein [Bacteroidia bacterium]|nr:Rieske 2Fe-2S domain-containing protein [Bacteroidia bacterium]